MGFLIIVLLAVCILIPLFYTVRVLRLAEGSKTGWFIVVADATVFVSLIFLVGRWDIAGYYTRFVLLGLFCAAILWSLRAHLSLPWRPGASALKKHWASIVTLVLFTVALLHVLSGMSPPPDTRQLAFPLQGGRFFAAQAGAVGILNRHAGHSTQRFAADITALYPSGFRARGIMPNELENYAAFGAAVVSPCAGEVVAIRTDLPDLVPPERDRDNASGNHVVLACGDLAVELAHLMQDSVHVEVGEQVSIGDAIGKVGNSGNTTEPHLHVHAFAPATDRGVPIAFDGRFPVRNDVFE